MQTLQLCADRDQSDVVGDLSVCLDGMTVDPEMFATAEADHHSESGLTEGPQAEHGFKSIQPCLNIFKFIFVILTVKDAVNTVITALVKLKTLE